MEHDRLRGFPTDGGSGIAVHPVLGDIDVQGGEVAGTKLVDRVENLSEFKRFIGLAGFLNDAVEAFHDPAVEDGHLSGIDSVGGRVEVGDVAQEDAKGVAEAAVRFRDLFEEVFSERNFVLPVHGGGPETDDVSTVFVVKILGVSRFAGGLGIGFGCFFTGILVDDKGMGHDGLVWGGAAPGDGEHERALEPATMLVSGFKIEVARSMQFRASFENGDVRTAGVDPDVQRVAAFAKAGTEPEAGAKFLVGEFEPDIGAFFFYEVGYPTYDFA